MKLDKIKRKDMETKTNSKELKNSKSLKMLESIFKRQIKLNDKTKPDWKDTLTPADWDTAVLVEAGEAIDSLNWKWWKHQSNDLDNFDIELIDILHF